MDEEVDSSDDADALHEPHTSLGALTCPALTVSGSNTVYTCTTTGINLASDTTYVFVVDSSSSANNSLQNTASNMEDTGGASGWSIADNSIYRNRGSTVNWTTFNESKKIRINGTTKSVTNNPATGVAIDGVAQVGKTLTVLTNDIQDDDGVSGPFTYQWFSGDDAITGQAHTTYTVTSADVGKNVKVRVSFTDDGGNQETPTKSTRRKVVPAAADHCDTSTIWCATMSAGTLTVEEFGLIAVTHAGYRQSSSYGSLDDLRFDHRGVEYEVTRLDAAGDA